MVGVHEPYCLTFNMTEWFSFHHTCQGKLLYTFIKLFILIWNIFGTDIMILYAYVEEICMRKLSLQ